MTVCEAGPSPDPDRREDRTVISDRVVAAESGGTDADAGFYLKISAQRVHQLRTTASEVHADDDRRTAALALGDPVPSGRSRG